MATHPPSYGSTDLLRVGVNMGEILFSLDHAFIMGVLRFARWQGRWHLSRSHDLLPILRDDDLTDWEGDGLLSLTP